MTAHEGHTKLSVWKMGSTDTDLMNEEKSLHALNSNGLPTKIAMSNESGICQNIAFGSSVNNITFLDTERFEKIIDCSGQSFFVIYLSFVI